MNVVDAHLILDRESAHSRILIASSVIIACRNQSISGQNFWISSQVADFLEVIKVKIVSVDFLKLFSFAEMSSENSDPS